MPCSEICERKRFVKSIISSRLSAIILVAIICAAGISAYAAVSSIPPAAPVAQAQAASAANATATAIPIDIQVTSTPAVAPATDYTLPDQALAEASKQYLVGDLWIRTELYFGTSKPHGQVSDMDFEGFVDSIVTPRFPDGLTLLTGYGQFRNSKGVIEQEKSHVLVLLYPPDDREANGEIEEIRDKYKRRFEQESVLRVDSFAQVSF
jgi:hypothetical protein